MVGIPGHTAPGTVGVSENVHDMEGTQRLNALEYSTVDKLNEAFVDKLVGAARRRMKAFKGSTETEAISAIDQKRLEYMDAFRSFWNKQGMDVDNTQAEGGWQNVRRQAVEAFYAAPYEGHATAKPAAETTDSMPPPPPPPQAAERETASPDVVLPMLVDSQWRTWEEEVYSKGSYLRFISAFVPELAVAIRQLPDDAGQREPQMEKLKDLFQRLLFQMYLNANPEFLQSGDPGEQGIQDKAKDRMAAAWANIEVWMGERWAEVLSAAQRLPDTTDTAA